MVTAIKCLLRSVRDFPARRALVAQRARLVRPDDADPVLSFGGVLENRSLIHGGAVKLLHLHKAFAANEQTFNVLYAVSSAQPPFVGDLIRACKDRGIVVVWNQNGVGYPAWAGAETERHNAPMREARAMADYVIYQSEFCRTSAEKFLGPCSVPSQVLVNPVDLQHFCPSAIPLPHRPLRLLAIGTQNYPDRVRSTIDCLKVLRDGGENAVLTIAGKLLWKGADCEVVAWIDRLGLTDVVTIRPAFSQDEAVTLYQGHHIVLHPKYMDPCPTVAIEALACGLPVVGSASGGLPELVPPSTGRLVETALDWDRTDTPSGPELAAAVAEILPKLAKFSAAARQFAETTFDQENWVARHGGIFRSLLS